MWQRQPCREAEKSFPDKCDGPGEGLALTVQRVTRKSETVGASGGRAPGRGWRGASTDPTGDLRVTEDEDFLQAGWEVPKGKARGRDYLTPTSRLAMAPDAWRRDQRWHRRKDRGPAGRGQARGSREGPSCEAAVGVRFGICLEHRAPQPSRYRS